MEESGFFPSNNGDRKYKSDFVASFFSKLFTNGVFNDELQVVANDNMSITLKKGTALINGYFYQNLSDKVINIDLSDSSQSRIDSIVLRFDKENRKISVDVLSGEYATSPVPPTLTRNSNIYELRLCNINVAQEIDKITSSMLEDTRAKTTDCGIVIQAIQTPDITNIFESCLNQVAATVEDIKGILTQDVASNLTGEILSLRTALGLNNDTYDSTKTYTVGDMVIKNHAIYECTTAITTAEAWNSSHWTIVPIIKN